MANKTTNKAGNRRTARIDRKSLYRAMPPR